MAITNLLLAAVARVLETTTYSDGDTAPLSTNTKGRLRVETKPAALDAVSGATAAAASTFIVDVTEAATLGLTLKNTGTATMAAGQFIFEASENSTNGTDGDWVNVQGSRSNTNQADPSLTNPALAASAVFTAGWRFNVGGYTFFRVRVVTTPTASSVATWVATRSVYASEPTPAIGAHAVTGSGTFTIAPVVGTGFSQTSAASTNAALVQTGSRALREITISNVTAAKIYVKLYNKSTAPTVGTDIPILTIPVEAGATWASEFGLEGKRFSVGIGIATTAAGAANDTTVVTAGAQISLTHTA